MKNQMMDGTRELIWKNDNEFVVGGIRFYATIEPNEYYTRKSTMDEFLIVKNRAMIEREIAIPARNILDLGIWQGGSVALYDLALGPQKLVALEYNRRAPEALAAYISQRGRREIVRPYYGVNQGDARKLRAILDAEFAGQTIDLVVDDASHFYEETRACFNTVFPRLSSGGSYIIEDWGWSHHDIWTNPYFKDKPALTNLLVEIAILSVTRPDLIAEITIASSMLIVKRGTGEVSRSFNIGDFITNKSQPIRPVF